MELADYDHRPGRHCGSTSLRNLADYYGWGFDEPTCFGLASGLGFTYVELDEPPTRAFFGRPMYLERAFFQTLSIPHEEHEGGSWAETADAITGAIDDGHPVMIFTDIYDLDYYGTDTHFAPHSLLVTGYDDEGFVLSDSEFDDPQYLPEARVRAAMTSSASTPIENRYLVVTDPTIGTDLDEAVVRSTEYTAEYMLAPGRAHYDPGPGTHGLAGVQRFAMEMAEWHTFPEPRWTARFAYQNIERRGTGGGAFRGLQRDFFQAVDHPFEGAADEMAAITDAWTAIGEELKAASETDDDGAFDDHLLEAGGDVSDLARREASFYQSVLDAT